MTDLHADRSYDDLPESDVATILQVPLTWGQNALVVSTPPRTGAHRRSSGRHRSAPQTHKAPADRWVDHPMVHTTRVGLVSAGLVLGAIAGILLALALWLP